MGSHGGMLRSYPSSTAQRADRLDHIDQRLGHAQLSAAEQNNGRSLCREEVVVVSARVLRNRWRSRTEPRLS